MKSVDELSIDTNNQKVNCDACVKSAKVIIVVGYIKRVPCDSIISSSYLPMDRKVERDSRLHKFISLSGRGIVKFQSK